MEMVSPLRGRRQGWIYHEKGLLEAFEVELRGRLGGEQCDFAEMKLLNPVFRITPKGLSYDADPRHVELLARALGLEQCQIKSTPGAKDCAEEAIAGGVARDDGEANEQMRNFRCSLKFKKTKSQTKVRFAFPSKCTPFPTPPAALVATLATSFSMDSLEMKNSVCCLLTTILSQGFRVATPRGWVNIGCRRVSS